MMNTIMSRIIFLVGAACISVGAFALPTITVIHKAPAYQNRTGYLKVQIGAFRMCIFQDNTPIKAGSTFVINLNDIAKYTQIGTDCSQKKLDHMLKGPTRYIASVDYPPVKKVLSGSNKAFSGFYS